MEVEKQILHRLLELREKTNSKKLIGALTVELIRKHLIKEGLNISARNVFIERVPYEFDLLALRKGAKAIENLVYRPEEVIAVLEIKFRGCYGKKTLNGIKSVFDAIKGSNSKIKCIYVTISENEKYKHRVTSDKLGHEIFELFLRSTNLESALKKNTLESTGAGED